MNEAMQRRGNDSAQPSAVLLRGAPAVVKTTHLIDQGFPGVVCEVDTFRRMIAGIDWSDRRLHAIALV